MKLLSDWPPFLESTWIWCIENFSLRKIVLATFVIALIFSISYQMGVVFPEITTEHPYSDALIYQNLAKGDLPYFGPTHITHRFLAPSIIQFLGDFIPVPSQYLFLVIQFGLLILVLRRIYSQTDGLALSFFIFLLMGLPTFWRGYFLPMTDSFLWAFLSLFWIEARNKNANFFSLLLFSLLAFFSKEMAALALILLVFSHLPSKKKAIFAFLTSGLVWLFVDFMMSSSISSNYIYQANIWLFDWMNNVYDQWFLIPKYLLSGFGLIWFFWIFRVATGGKAALKNLLPELLLFSILFLFAATNSPRLLFPFTGIIAMRLFER